MTDLIAVDWGTSRLRAYLVSGGEVVAETASEEGMSTVAPGGFAAVLARHIAPWRIERGDVPVLMAGMAGSRNGWLEVPYVRCPAGPETLLRGSGRVAMADGGEASIVPGLVCDNGGIADVMRGEEVLIFGTGVADGIVVQPGTHSKWARVVGGRIERFRTFMTGEVFALLTGHSVLRLLAKEPASENGFAKGLDAARREGGLLHAAFAARTQVLTGAMDGTEVSSFLSGLLIGGEVHAAREDGAVVLVADGILAANYAKALAAEGIAATVMPPRDCFVRGIARIMS